MDIITGTREVFIQSEQHVYSDALVRLHDVVEHIIGRVEEGDGTKCERQYEVVVSYSCAETLIKQEQHEQHTYHKLHYNDIEGDDIDREKEREEGGTNRITEYGERLTTVVTIGVYHACGEQLHKQEHHKLAYRRGRVAHQHLLKLYADNEIDNHRHARKQHTARHSLTIEHEREGEIDQRRACLTLPHDAKHGEKYYATRRGEMLGTVYIEAIAANKLCQCQCRGKLTKLRWLQTQRTNHQP